MPRPKPVEPLVRVDLRLTATHRTMLKQLGGVRWLRMMLEKHAPMPKKYYDRELERLQNPADAVFLQRRKGEEND